MPHRVSDAQRRARLGIRHLLADPAATVEAAATAVVALHATDPATVFLSLAARTGLPDVAEVERALYDERTLVRMLGMRRTMFVVHRDLAPVVQAACTGDIARSQHELLVTHLQRFGHPQPPPEAAAWLADVCAATVRCLRERGSAGPRELAEAEPRLRQQLRLAEGKPYAATGYVTHRVLSLLAMQGHIVRGRPTGSWLSTQYRWWSTGAWFGDDAALSGADPARARVCLARAWLSRYGPATLADLRWWTGWGARDTAATLARLAPAQVELDDGQVALVLPDDVADVPAPDPWVALLPALDGTPMGWTDRGFYLGAHRAALFDRSGNIGPTVWSNGRIVGGWAQRPDGEVVVRLLEDIGAQAVAAVQARAARLTAWLAGTRVIPKFRTPLERELAS